MKLVLDEEIVARTGEFRTVEKSNFLRRNTIITEEKVIVQTWDTNSGRDVGGKVEKWVEINRR